MLRPRQLPAARRRAVILMVVLALLTLFAIVGITFAFYAQKSHSASVNFRESWQLGFSGSGGGSLTPPDIDPNTLLRWSLGQLIYDVSDDATGVYSALRGYSFARTEYGFNDAILNIQPYNGTGRLHYTSAFGQDDYQLVNYTYFQGDGFVRDPERYGSRANLAAARGPFTGGANVNYTYPDLNSFFLGASRADGTQLMPSFHRPWLFNPGKALNDPTNPNWTNAQGKYLIARPRPVDMDPTTFPYPADAFGDVKNKLGSLNPNNDSIWMDLGYPVTTTPDGRKFKPLFAFLIEDLDGKINVNTAGNLMGSNGTTNYHASNQGWGKWEGSLAQIFTRPGATAEWRNLFLGNGTVSGRYGSDGVPRLAGAANVANGGRLPRFFGQVDYNGADESNSNLPTAPLTLPTTLFPFPNFPMGFGNGYQTGNQGERLNHALLYDYFRPTGVPATAPVGTLPPAGSDVVLPASDMKYLLYSGSTGSDVMSATVAQLCPQNFTPTAIAPLPLSPADALANLRRRSLITTLSMDLNRMGMAPWLLDRQTSGYAVSPTNWDQAPFGGQVSFPALTSRASAVPANSDFTVPGQAANVPAVDWRAVDAALEKVNLNVTMPPYPHQGGPNNSSTPMVTSYHDRFDAPTSLQGGATAAQVQAQFAAAQSARQALAADIYKRLVSVTGVPKPANPASPTDLELYPLRWLAQLAANIVDYVDEDEISTPFNFYGIADGLPAANVGDVLTNGTNAAGEKTPKYWVFGTELPPVVLNEVLTEYQLPVDAMKQPMAGNFNVKVWAELFTPFQKKTNNALQPQDGLAIPFYVAANGGSAAYSIYDVVVANTNTTNPGGPLLPQRDNVLGIPDQTRGDAVFPATTGTVGNSNANVLPTVDPAQGGYLIIGPPRDATLPNPADDTIATPRVPGTTPFVRSTGMQYQVAFTPATNWSISGTAINDRTDGVTVLLRRLANPHLPPNPNPLVGNAPNPLYNPYVTVDYQSSIPLNDNTTTTAAFQALGKLQPYASDRATQIKPQVYAPGGMAATIQHTLGAVNNPAPAGNKAIWLTHLDRQLTSPAELLQVSGYRPCLLTQKFITAAGASRHRVPWFDGDLAGSNPPASHRLYRLFAFLETADRASGISARGRVPGKVNINTIWEPEILRALLDRQPSNYFTDSGVGNDLDNLWTALLRTRTPGMLAGGNPTTTGGSIGSQDRPFLDPAAGFLPVGDVQAPNGRGVEDTVFRRQDPTNPLNTRRLFQAAPSNVAANAHPYLQNEMLAKVLGNLTTRSNVFAVWITVGFFDVKDDTTNPPKLGAEVNRANGTEIRHRFFAIVDRTQIVLAPALASSAANPFGQPPNVNGQVATAELNQPKTITVNPKVSPTDPLNGVNGTITYANGTQIPWAIQPGSLLMIDRGTPHEEVVQVTAVNAAANPPNFTAVFTREHAQGFSITICGNPGPQPQFDPRDPGHAPVVPYFTILQ